MDPTTCIHCSSGLCEQCQEEYDDPSAWLEYGQHPQGISNWKALEEEMAQWHAARLLPSDEEVDVDIPF